ncbi:hypothetical protein F5051DRAFT_504267 [Lentinula edodes]|nr:hypothetical protein F5051DRAFT_504267 [Lentinula edodes]
MTAIYKDDIIHIEPESSCKFKGLADAVGRPGHDSHPQRWPQLAPIVNGRLIFNEIPSGKTTVYDTTSTKVDPEQVPLNGSILAQQLRNGESENSAFQADDHVFGILDFAEYTTPKDISLLKVIARPEPSLPYSVYVGAVGMPGQTSYCWKWGDVVFISTAAGTVGSILVQLAMQDGLEVIAFAGSDEKVKFCKEIGADVVFNYKTTTTADILAREGPINIYWDNVGWIYTRSCDCEYGSWNQNHNLRLHLTIQRRGGPRNQEHEIHSLQSVEHQGFRVDVFYERYKQELYQVIPKKLASGEIEYMEDMTRGLEKGGEAILEVQKGMNAAKKIIVIADDWRIEAISRTVKSPRNALSLIEKLLIKRHHSNLPNRPPRSVLVYVSSLKPGR